MADPAALLVQSRPLGTPSLQRNVDGSVLRGHGGPPRLVLLLALLALAGAAQAEPLPLQDFGRWERSVSSCRLQIQEEPLAAATGMDPFPRAPRSLPVAPGGAAPAPASASVTTGKRPAPTPVAPAAAPRVAPASAAVRSGGPPPASSLTPGLSPSPPPPLPADPSATAAPPAAAPSAAGRSASASLPETPAEVPAAGMPAVAHAPAVALARPRLSGCRSLRLDQQMAGWLSVRLLPVFDPAHPAVVPLVFAGVLAEGSRPLRCNGGRCELDGPILLRISSVASGRAGGSDPLAFLPRSRLAQGRCHLDGGQASCQARDAEGRHWSAEVRW